MNKFNLIKRYILSALVILYDIVSLFWCYIILSAFVFRLFSLVSPGENSIGIIGAADMPTTLFIVTKLYLPCILFTLLSLVTAVLASISAICKKTHRLLHILVCVFAAISLLLFLLIPSQIYAVKLFALASRFGYTLIGYASVMYKVISAMMVVTHAVWAVRKEGK